MGDEINKGTIQFLQTYDMNDEPNIPFVEIGAIYKILDFITDSDPRISSLTNSCCNEISKTLQCLLADRHDKRLQDLLLSDPSLCKCEHCGVISCSLRSHSIIGKTEENSAKVNCYNKIMPAEREYVNNEQINKEPSILPIPSRLKKDNMQSRPFIDTFEIDHRNKYTDRLNGAGSQPIKECAFAIKNYIELHPNDSNNISETEVETNAKTEDTSRLLNNAINKLLADETAETETEYRFNNIAHSNYPYNYESIVMAANADIDKEEIVRKISYEPKPQIDNLLAANRPIKNMQKYRDPFGTHTDNIYSVTNAVKYLTRGRFTALEKKEREHFSKLPEKDYIHLGDTKMRRNNVLYDDEDNQAQHNFGFWLFDKSGRLPQLVLDEYRYIPMPKLEDNGDNLHTNTWQQASSVENQKEIGYWTDCIEKDSLENCALLEQRESDTTILSSSSAENMIYEWMQHSKGKEKLNDVDDDISKGHKLISSRPLLDIARHIRTDCENRQSDNAEVTMCEQQTHRSNVFARLSPKTRSRVYYLAQRMVLSDCSRDSKFHKKHLISNHKKLFQSKSVNDTLVHNMIKMDMKTRDTSANDCIPIKLPKSREDKDYLFAKQDITDVYNQSLNETRNDFKVYHENVTTLLSDKFEKFPCRHSEKIAQRIIYKNLSLKNIADNHKGYLTAEVLSIYRKILESSENMDWKNFRGLVERLHPDQKKLWREICKTISKEANKVASNVNDSVEVCIEISPIVAEEVLKADKVTTHSREIVFEMDMTLKDVKSYLHERLRPTKKHLDIHKGAYGGVMS